MIIYTILYKNHPKQTDLTCVTEYGKKLALEWLRSKMNADDLEVHKILEINLIKQSIDEVVPCLKGIKLDFVYKNAPLNPF